MCPTIGAERYVLSTIDHRDVVRAALERGWKGGDGILDYCDANGQARSQEFDTLDAALKGARDFMATGHSTFGACFVDHQRYERAHDDRGQRVNGGAWEDVACFEVDAIGDVMECDV